MIKSMTVVSLIALATLVASPASAERDTRVGYGSGPGNIEDIAEERGIDLNSDQRVKITALREAHLKDVKPLQEQLFIKSRQLKDLWLARTPDRENILTLQREVQLLRSQLMDKLTTYRLDAWQLLTPEQQAKVRSRGPERRSVPLGGPGMMGDRENVKETRGPMPPLRDVVR
jgi:Spy/CpxP family protein refolding chaperone